MAPRIASFSNTYARLPAHFYARVAPTPVARPRLLALNGALAQELGLELAGQEADTLAALFAGNQLAEGSEPIALAYAGHQFGGFSPQLGDGRAILLGEVRDTTGVLRDIQLKGSGRTPFSRRGDGRAALGPVLREYLVSEAMHALGIPATRALAAVSTGELVRRETALPGAVFTRVARSHVRVGTFQYFAARGDEDGVRVLADYVIDRLYPEARGAARPYLALLDCVSQAQAELIARWMGVGFIHGVMNTDNMAISGETIDFGPCAFLEAYDPDTVFSAIDESGRYAFGNQPRMAQWNLTRLAETLLPLVDAQEQRAVELAQECLAAFPGHFDAHWQAVLRAKLGLVKEQAGDQDLAMDLLDLMRGGQADFTLTFRELCSAVEGGQGPRARFADGPAYAAWEARWQARLRAQARDPLACAQSMRRANPAYIPRNHRVEQALQAAVREEDTGPFARLLAVLGRPYEEQQGSADYALPALPEQRVLRTFCGT